MAAFEEKKCDACSEKGAQCFGNQLCFLSQKVRDEFKQYWVQKVIDANLKVKKAYDDFSTYKMLVEEWKEVINNLEKFGDYDANFTKILKLKNAKITPLATHYWWAPPWSANGRDCNL